MKNRVEIKAQSKAMIRNAKVPILLMAVLFLGIGLVLDRVSTLITYGSLFPELTEIRWFLSNDALSFALEGDVDGVLQAAGIVSRDNAFTFFFSVLVSLFMVLLSGGYKLHCMGVRMGRVLPYGTLFDGLSCAGRLIWCSILMRIKIFLWSLLFGFPGLIAAYRYRFAIYNILTDDSLSAGEAIRLSCRQTRGMKLDLFVLDLSFIGWNILSSLTLGLLEIWLTPYTTLCDLAYFELGQQKLGRSPYGGQSAGEDPFSFL